MRERKIFRFACPRFVNGQLFQTPNVILKKKNQIFLNKSAFHNKIVS